MEKFLKILAVSLNFQLVIFTDSMLIYVWLMHGWQARRIINKSVFSENMGSYFDPVTFLIHLK